MTLRYHLPLDPNCQKVKKFYAELTEDPITAYSGCGSEIWENFKATHHHECSRCRSYICANIDIEDFC